MWQTMRAPGRDRPSLPDRLSWAGAAPLIGLLSIICWVVVLGIAPALSAL